MYYNLAFSEVSLNARISLSMRISGFRFASFTSTSSVLITPRCPRLPQLLSRSLREKERNKFWKAYAAQRWLLNWNGKMSSVLLCKNGDEKMENPPSPSREFLTAWHKCSQDNPLHNLWIIYISRWVCINITFWCLAGWEWTQTFLGSYRLTVLSLRPCDGGRIHREKGDSIRKRGRYIDRNPGTDGTVM